MKTSRIAVALLLAVLVSVSGMASTAGEEGNAARPKTLPLGVWGGHDISMEVKDDGVEIEFDCARGMIIGPLVLDAGGRFHAKGSYKVEVPAPVALDQAAGSEAVYTGRLNGSRLRLEIAISGQQEPMSFDLFRGRPGVLKKCA
jgi:hypothetical protein